MCPNGSSFIVASIDRCVPHHIDDQRN